MFFFFLMSGPDFYFKKNKTLSLFRPWSMFLKKAGVKKADKHLYPTQTSASMSPNTFRPPTLTFNPSIFPSSLPLYMAATGGALLFVAGAGKGRSGLHLSFASCYHFSHLCTHPAPSLPLFLFTSPHPSLPPSFCLWHPAIGLEWSEERRGRNSRTTLNFWPFNSVNLQLPAAYELGHSARLFSL